MQKKYKRAIVSGIIGVALLFILFIIMLFLLGPIAGDEARGVDTGPAAVGAAMLFVIASLISMIFIGGFSVWWAFGRAFRVKDAMEISAIAGAVPTILLCLIIGVFEVLVSTYGPSPEFSFTAFLNTLFSGLSICCIIVFGLGIVLSVFGGLLYACVIFLIKKA